MNVTGEIKEGLEKALDRMRIKGKKDECYGWKGTSCKRGFARIIFRNKTTMAHRAAWMAEYGKIPMFKYIRHTCKNKLCTNPKHLFSSSNKGKRIKHEDRVNGRLRRERLGVDLPSRLVWGIKRASKKRNITVTKYMCILLTRVLEIEKSYEKK